MRKTNDVLAGVGQNAEEIGGRGGVGIEIARVGDERMRGAADLSPLPSEVDVAVTAEPGVARPFVAGHREETAGIVELRAERVERRPKTAGNLEVVALVRGGVEKRTIAGEDEIVPRAVGAYGLLRLPVKVGPVRQQPRSLDDAHGVGPGQHVAALVLDPYVDVGGCVDRESGEDETDIAGCEAHGARKAVHGDIAAQVQLRRHSVAGITPFVLGLELERKRLARPAHGRQHADPAGRWPCDDANRRLHRERLVDLGGDGVDQHVELEGVLAERLQPQTGRASAGITEAYRDGVAFAQEAVNDSNLERAIPGSDVALGVVATTQHGIVRCRNGGVTDRRRVVELWSGLIGRKPKTHAQRAGVVDAVSAGRIDQGECLVGPGRELARRGDGRGSQLGGGDGLDQRPALQSALERVGAWGFGWHDVCRRIVRRMPIVQPIGRRAQGCVERLRVAGQPARLRQRFYPSE